MDSRSGLLHLRIYVPIGNEDIQPAIIVVIEESASETEHLACRPRNSGFVTHFVEESFSIVVPKMIRGPLKVGDIEIELPVVIVVAQSDAHRSHDRSPRCHGHTGGEADLLESTVVLVVVKVCIQPVISYEQVRPAVVVVVGGLHGKILALWLINPSRLRHVGERAIVIIAVKRVGTPLVLTGRTTAQYLTQLAVTLVAQSNVAADIQIQPPISIVVE